MTTVAEPLNQKIFSVREIITLSSQLVENLGIVHVEAEILSIKEVQGKYTILDIGDGKSGETYDTSMQAWVYDLKLRRQIVEQKLSPGESVLLKGTLSIFRKRGVLTLRVLEITRTGLGNLLLEFERLKRFYAERGYFSQERKKNVPKFVSSVGIITSISSGIVLADFYYLWRVLYPRAKIIVRDCLMQGKNSAQVVAGSIEFFNSTFPVDVILIMRGGGSISDLWTFNEKDVVEAIYRSRTPVVTAIGHEADITLSDLVADLRAPTPTGAASLILPDRQKLMAVLRGKILSLLRFDGVEPKARELTHLDQVLAERADKFLSNIRKKLEGLDKALSTLNPDLYLAERKQKLNGLLYKFYDMIFLALKNKLSKLLNCSQILLKIDLKHRMSNIRESVLIKYSRLNVVIEKIRDIREELYQLSSKFFSMSPLEPLQRGFALMVDETGRPVDFGSLEVNQKVKALFKDGEVFAKILEKHERNIIGRAS